ncbi:MAG: hypothetical protein FWE85_00535 [Clostridiales bacterium]|nr:hypothetical protein [Clostridiales bacterium]
MEHEKNLLARERLKETGKTRGANDRMRVLLDATPFGIHIATPIKTSPLPGGRERGVG